MIGDNMDHLAWLRKVIADGDADLVREMLKVFAQCYPHSSEVVFGGQTRTIPARQQGVRDTPNQLDAIR